MTTGLPTLSSIRAWDVEHLVDAANHWDGTADRWENVSIQVWQQSRGLDWEGQARDALIERTTTDKTTVIGKADQLREAATIARRGAGDISAAQRRVMYAVQDAHNAEFTVGEDLSVTDTRTRSNAAELAVRQAQAQVLAANIRECTAELVGLDTEVGGKITGAAGDVGDTAFAERLIKKPGNKGTIQLTGFGAKDDPPLPPAPPQPPAPIPPQSPAIKLPPRTGPPPVQVITAGPPPPDPSKHHCGPAEIGKDTVIAVGGATGIASGIAGEIPTLGATTAAILAGLGALWDGMDKLSECD